MVQNGPYGPKWSRTVQNGPDPYFSETVQNGRKGTKPKILERYIFRGHSLYGLYEKCFQVLKAMSA